MFWDRQGNKLDVHAWADLQADDAYKVIAQDAVGGARVSTIWVGLDGGYGLRAEPLTFESATWRPQGGRLVLDVVQRYPTEAAALAGHQQLLADLGL